MSDYKPINLVNLLMVLIPVMLEDEHEQYHNSSLTGNNRYHEYMHLRSDTAFKDVNRTMDKTTFSALVRFLREKAGLEDSRYLTAGEKLMIFIAALKGKHCFDLKLSCQLTKNFFRLYK